MSHCAVWRERSHTAGPIEMRHLFNRRDSKCTKRECVHIESGVMSREFHSRFGRSSMTKRRVLTANGRSLTIKYADHKLYRLANHVMHTNRQKESCVRSRSQTPTTIIAIDRQSEPYTQFLSHIMNFVFVYRKKNRISLASTQTHKLY